MSPSPPSTSRATRVGSTTVARNGISSAGSGGGSAVSSGSPRARSPPTSRWLVAPSTASIRMRRGWPSRRSLGRRSTKPCRPSPRPSRARSLRARSATVSATIRPSWRATTRMRCDGWFGSSAHPRTSPARIRSTNPSTGLVRRALGVRPVDDRSNALRRRIRILRARSAGAGPPRSAIGRPERAIPAHWLPAGPNRIAPTAAGRLTGSGRREAPENG